MVERFNCTLTVSYKWIEELPRLVSEYNGSKHCIIGIRSIDVILEIAKRLLSIVYSNVKIAAPAKFRVGDSVRVSKFKTIFVKIHTELVDGDI